MNKILKEKEITEALELDEEIRKFSEADDYNTENIYRQLHCESKICIFCDNGECTNTRIIKELLKDSLYMSVDRCKMEE